MEEWALDGRLSTLVDWDEGELQVVGGLPLDII